MISAALNRVRDKPTCSYADAECKRSGCTAGYPKCAPLSNECYVAELRMIKATLKEIGMPEPYWLESK